MRAKVLVQRLARAGAGLAGDHRFAREIRPVGTCSRRVEQRQADLAFEFLICIETAAGVRCGSSAARAKLECRAADVKTRSRVTVAFRVQETLSQGQQIVTFHEREAFLESTHRPQRTGRPGMNRPVDDGMITHDRTRHAAGG